MLGPAFRSSLGFGAFMEHGPFQPGDSGLLFKNEYPWNLGKPYLAGYFNWFVAYKSFLTSRKFLLINIKLFGQSPTCYIYVESPIGVGFSYSNILSSDRYGCHYVL